MAQTFLRRVWERLRRHFLGPSWYAYVEETRRRPRLDDDAFYEQFYAGTGIPKDIPVRVRIIFESIVGLDRRVFRPGDNIFLNHEELDLAELIWRLEREFKMKVDIETAFKGPIGHKGKMTLCRGEIDGSFDSVVRYLARVRREQQAV